MPQQKSQPQPGPPIKTGLELPLHFSWYVLLLIHQDAMISEWFVQKI